MTIDDIAKTEASPFHAGERSVQERLGVRDIESWAKRVVRDYLPAEHREFHTALPFVIASARDENGRPWATVLEGPDGFVTSPDPRHLIFQARPGHGDALAGAFVEGADMGILGIELATRRRNRVNGHVLVDDSDGISFAVDQSFGNCPQYIRERAWRRVERVTNIPAVRSTHLSARQTNWILCADTFFIASGYRGKGDSPTYGMDVSHRGGDRGFIQVLSDTEIRFPDYAGNNHYNTLGNLLLDPRAGFLFIDFGTGSLLQLSGRASIDWDSDDISEYTGAKRLITLQIEEIVEQPYALGLRWQLEADSVRSLRLIEKIPESEDVTSFVFDARDGGSLMPFKSGQHLPIELMEPGLNEPIRRTYSLSGPPNESTYRITVKREPNGLASRYLHDRLEPGAIIQCRPPSGDFVLDCSECPLVLISSGVGVTPMMSILHATAAEERDRPIWFIHGARDGDHHPFKRETRKLATDRPNIRVHVAYSRPRPEDKLGTDFDSEGRISAELFERCGNQQAAQYYICGPISFMAAVQEALLNRHVDPDQIHVESFGSAGGLSSLQIESASPAGR